MANNPHLSGAAGINDACHTWTGRLDPHQRLIIRTPQIIAVYWDDFFSDPAAVARMDTFFDQILVSGWADGLAQYGVQRGTRIGSVRITDAPPARLSRDEMENTIINWLKQGKINPKPQIHETQKLYVIITPHQTQLSLIITTGLTQQTYFSGINFCGYHQYSRYLDQWPELPPAPQLPPPPGLPPLPPPPPPPPPLLIANLFWAVIPLTDPAGKTVIDVIDSITPCVSHEMAEAFTDRSQDGYQGPNGCEIGDVCETKNNVEVDGWLIERYWSDAAQQCFPSAQPFVAVGANKDSSLEVVYVKPDGNIYWNQQNPPANLTWAGESRLDSAAQMIAMGSNKDGRLEAFYVGTNRQLYHRRQVTVNGSWGAQAPLGSSGKMIAVGSNADGRLEVFYVGTDDQIYHDWQTDTSNDPAWNGKVALGGSAKMIAVGIDAYQCLEIFYVGTDDNIYCNRQIAANGSGGWYGEVALGGSAKMIAVGSNKDGQLEIFYVGMDDNIYHNRQTGPGNWAGGVALGGAAKRIAVGSNEDKRLEIFYIGTDDNIYHNWQNTPNDTTWYGETALGGAGKRIAVGSNAGKRLEVFYVGTDDNIYHNWQVAANGNWSGESRL